MEERIVRIVREYTDWSPAELRQIDAITVEVLEHCRTGTGNEFIKWFVNTQVVPKVPGFVVRW